MKRILITGAADGLGKKLAQLCLSKHIDVVCLDIVRPDYVCEYIKCDLIDRVSIESTVETIQNHYSQFDALVNCAGIHGQQNQGDISFDKLQAIFGANIMGPMYLTSCLMSLIKSNEADVMNIGSSAGTKGTEGLCVYGSTKWAMRGMSANLQTELRHTKSRVFQLNPGGFKSDIYKKSGQDVDMTTYMDPAEIAKIMLFALEMPKNIEMSEIVINRKV
jgi:3-oxoacyl-[acyl-carrier protein] reductase